MGDILPKEGDKIRLIFRNFPLPMHPWARAAAEAAACARMQDDRYFWQLHDYIFTHQRDLSAANMSSKLSEQAAGLEGFDVAQFQACIDNKETTAKVDRDVEFGKQLKVEATPTLFINGQRVSGYRAEEIRTLVREHLASDGATAK